MKEKISKKIYNILTLDRYLQVLGISLLLVGLGLFFYCVLSVQHQYMLPSLVLRLQTMSNPLFYLVFGFSILLFRYFLKVTDKEIEV